VKASSILLIRLPPRKEIPDPSFPFYPNIT
jgi:hypothetical protein